MEDVSNIDPLSLSNSNVSIRTLRNNTEGLNDEEKEGNHQFFALQAEFDILKRAKEENEKNFRQQSGLLEAQILELVEQQEKNQKELQELKIQLEEERNGKMILINQIKKIEEQLQAEKIKSDKVLKSQETEQKQRREAIDRENKEKEEKQRAHNKITDIQQRLIQYEKRNTEIEFQFRALNDEFEKEKLKSKELEDNLSEIQIRFNATEKKLSVAKEEKQQDSN